MERNEAIGVVRSFIDKLAPEHKEALSSLLPELAESEDERIRKFLKDYAIEMIAGLESDISISVYDGVKGHDPEAEAELEKWKGARAWLEKQKEQKLADLPSSGSGAMGTNPPAYKLDVKPAEWSEEDDGHIDAICRALTDNMSNIGFYTTEALCSWLKSLRPQPHWKPSEEQMEALEQAKISAECGNFFTKDGLKSLYEQLKKLQ